jgi:hypothetical protein
MTKETIKPEKSWPRGILIAYIIFVCMTVGFVVFTFTVNFDLVVPDYYNQTLAFEDQIERKQNMESLSEPVSVRLDESQIFIQYPAELLSESVSGTVALYRPSDASLDQLFSVNPDTSGMQIISGSQLSKGMWTLKITVVTPNKEYYDEYPVFLR